MASRGTVDLCVRTRRGNPAVFDYKARARPNPANPSSGYDEHILQVAAYAATAIRGGETAEDARGETF